jgi:hypothetical protein
MSKNNRSRRSALGGFYCHDDYGLRIWSRERNTRIHSKTLSDTCVVRRRVYGKILFLCSVCIATYLSFRVSLSSLCFSCEKFTNAKNYPTSNNSPKKHSQMRFSDQDFDLSVYYILNMMGGPQLTRRQQLMLNRNARGGIGKSHAVLGVSDLGLSLGRDPRHQTSRPRRTDGLLQNTEGHHRNTGSQEMNGPLQNMTRSQQVNMSCEGMVHSQRTNWPPQANWLPQMSMTDQVQTDWGGQDIAMGLSRMGNSSGRTSSRQNLIRSDDVPAKAMEQFIREERENEQSCAALSSSEDEAENEATLGRYYMLS